MSSLRRRRMIWMTAVAFYTVGCLLFDFYPDYGPPHFRYSDSDPNRAVWNLGLPTTWFIYDPSVGLLFGPLSETVVGAQLTVLVFLLWCRPER